MTDLTGWFRLMDEKSEIRFLPLTHENLVMIASYAYLIGKKDGTDETLKEWNRSDIARITGVELKK